jgi:hypothetical protein
MIPLGMTTISTNQMNIFLCTCLSYVTIPPNANILFYLRVPCGCCCAISEVHQGAAAGCCDPRDLPVLPGLLVGEETPHEREQPAEYAHDERGGSTSVSQGEDRFHPSRDDSIELLKCSVMLLRPEQGRWTQNPLWIHTACEGPSVVTETTATVLGISL